LGNIADVMMVTSTEMQLQFNQAECSQTWFTHFDSDVPEHSVDQLIELFTL